MRRVVLLAAVLCGVAPAQEWAQKRLEMSTRHQEWLYLKHGARTVDTFIVYPEVSHKTPVVVVIHDNHGLTEWEQSLADAIAEAGYIAIAPDLLAGAGPKGGGTPSFTPDAAAQAVARLTPHQITADLDAVADYAEKIPAANGKIAIAGFGWGALQAIRCASDHADLAAVYLFGGAELALAPARYFTFIGPPDFMRLGDAPEASGTAKQARDAAWERWKKLLAEL